MSEDKGQSRFGLYLMVVLILLNTCGLDTRLNDIEKKLNEIDKKTNIIVNTEMGSSLNDIEKKLNTIIKTR